MWRGSVRLVAGALACATALVGEDAAAQGWSDFPEESPSSDLAAPGTDEPVESAPPASSSASVHFDIGADGAYLTPPIHGGANPFGVGGGGHIALAYGHFYLGARVLDFLGDNDVDTSYRSLFAGVELGYEGRIALANDFDLVLRPAVGAGDAIVFYTDPSLLAKSSPQADVVTGASGSSGGRGSRSDTITVNNVYVEPSMSALLAYGKVYGGCGVSAMVLPGIVYGGASATTWLSYGGRLSLGFRF